MIDFRIKLSLTSRTTGLKELFSLLPVSKRFIFTEQLEIIMWGDPIFQDDFINTFKKNPPVDYIINHLYGHYYYMLLNKTNGDVCMGNSLFGILPVYYSQTIDNLTISNNQFLCSENNSYVSYNKRFLLENILFNYPLFNQTCISGNYLLPTNHYLKISNGKIKILRHTAIENYFAISTLSSKKSAQHLAEQFMQSVEKYLPKEPYISALTGGLDGRTLTACSLYLKRNFSTYCFGSDSSEDVLIASKLSALSGNTFHNIRLNEEYTRNLSLSEGLSFIKGSGGIASFSRAHYHYAVKQLAIKTRYLITGNFGSEVFRAAHIAGVVISPNLYRLLLARDYDDAISQIENSTEWQWIERNSFSDAWESLKEEIRTLPCFNPYYKGLTKNQQFYKIVFDEVFRKYFGAEMVNQYQYLVNRTPFLDIDFLKHILGTSWAGVHSDFFTHNPFKRFKGQVIYAHIINKTYPAFGKQLLDKGYNPSDLLSLQGKIKIASSWLNKKIVNKEKATDPYAVNTSFVNNSKFWKALAIDAALFNEENILKSINKMSQRDSLFIALSQAWFYNENFRYNSTTTQVL